MALKDSLKKIDFAKATDVVSSVTNSITHTFDKLKSKDDETDEQTIDSVDSLSCFLQSLQADASPSVIMALQSQIQVLKYVLSPTMMLMAVDNIMHCLYKACQAERTRINQAAMEYRNKLTVVSDIIDPINENIEKYTNNLYRIVEKYKYVV